MAWPKTFIAGTVPTAADLNTLSTPPSCQAYDNSGTINTTSGSITLVPLTSESWDYSIAMHDTGTNTSRMYARGTGKYLIDAQAAFPSNASTAYRGLYVYKNNNGDTTLATGTRLGYSVLAPGTGAAQYPRVVVTMALTDGDYIEMYAQQASGSTLALVAGPGNTSLTMVGMSA